LEERFEEINPEDEARENTHTTKLQPIQHYYLEEFNKPANNININMHKKSKKRSLMKINLGFIIYCNYYFFI
jgi:hypothetical protein